MRTKILILLILLMTFLLPRQDVSALFPADAQNDRVTFDFPNTATFSATLKSNARITSITLEYGDNQLTCGNVIAKAYPQFEPAQSVQAEWMWDMRQSGSLPPGAQIWWRWKYTDESGAEFVSERQTATWLDTVHDWQTIESGDLRVHWYSSDSAVAKTMLEAGVEGLRRNKEQAGLTTDAPIDLYIYSNTDDMRDSILYEPAWMGGGAFAEYNVVILGLSASDKTWDRNAVIHELTHVLIGQLTFSCIGSVPTWLNEGLAMYSEGELDSYSQTQLNQSISSNQLITLRSMSGGFSELPDKANLSYTQSQSVVKFLIETYGQDKMTELLTALRDSKPIDDALIETYGFDTDGLEDLWRKAVNAAPRAVSAQPTSQPTPTFVPTYVPMSGAPLAVTPTPYAVPTSSFDGASPEAPASPFKDKTFIFLTVVLACVCISMLLVVGIFILGFMARRDSAKVKGKKHAKAK
jgi:hypothetical protein